MQSPNLVGKSKRKNEPRRKFFSEESEDAISTMGTRGSGVSHRELFNGDDSDCGQTTLKDLANQVAAMDGHEPAKLPFALSAVNGTIVETGPDIHRADGSGAGFGEPHCVYRPAQPLCLYRGDPQDYGDVERGKKQLRHRHPPNAVLIGNGKHVAITELTD